MSKINFLFKKALKMTILSLFLVIITGFLLEIAMRVLKIGYLKLENESLYPNVLGDYSPSQNLNSDYILKHHIEINSQGIRGAEMQIAKQKNIKRILVLGDSYTYGARVDNDKTFPAYLQKFYDDSNKTTEVINAGHSAYSTREEYEYLLERGSSLDPEAVILTWFPNDIQELGRDYSWRDLLKTHYKYEPYKSYVRSLALYSVMRIYITSIFVKMKFGNYVPKEEINIFDGNDTQVESKLWQKCFDYILKTEEFCKRKNIKFLLVVLDSPDQFINNPDYKFQAQDKLIEFAKNNGINALDTSPRFTNIAQNNNFKQLYLLPKDPHFSPYGNKVVAEEIFKYLHKNTLTF